MDAAEIQVTSQFSDPSVGGLISSSMAGLFGASLIIEGPCAPHFGTAEAIQTEPSGPASDKVMQLC